ncbi:thioredoxin-like protein [Lanmaoa asiatica]|nr:thioredoxin-like protein [Lanmaoa asiatica]
MNQVVAELAKKHPELLVLQVEAEELQDISESFDIEAVPSIIILRVSFEPYFPNSASANRYSSGFHILKGHTLLARISGADAPAMTKAVDIHLGKRAQVDAHAEKHEESGEELEARMRHIMQKSPVVLFMKGDPDNPRCGFSKKAVNLLREQKVAFTHFDILADEAVRQGLKKFNDWPTYPQFIVNGEFVGGLDVVSEMADNGEFADVFAMA